MEEVQQSLRSTAAHLEAARSDEGADDASIIEQSFCFVVVCGAFRGL